MERFKGVKNVKNGGFALKKHFVSKIFREIFTSTAKLKIIFGLNHNIYLHFKETSFNQYLFKL